MHRHLQHHQHQQHIREPAALLDIAIDDKRHGERRVLHGLRLQLARGEIISLIGASGCGKSSLLNIVAGLDAAYSGAIRLGGLRQRGASGDIGLIFQEPRLFPWLTVAQNIAFADDGANAGRVPALLEQVGLPGYGGNLIKQLSGGQAQRVAIARGLYTHPKILLLDEPFSAVDAFTRMKLQDLLLRVAREHGLTVLLVTHDIDEALYLGDRVVMLEAAGAPPAIFDVGAARPRGQRCRSGAALAPLRSAILDRLHAAQAI
ncbi:ABC transporter ATP-binding protein [Rugamonas sp.]|uniref:ABC transporter ATP-binding protein n=1 Tax=Rugamonas sp. TaxID=1926287 RepID=UPI0025F06AD6|nr:ABC transporter ATP-binding protein [Rugamonas sp.]